MSELSVYDDDQLVFTQPDFQNFSTKLENITLGGRRKISYCQICQIKRGKPCKCEHIQKYLLKANGLDVSDAHVKCFHWTECAWIGPLKSLNEHIKTECINPKVECTKCSRPMRRNQLINHLNNDCDMRLQCRGCRFHTSDSEEFSLHQVACLGKQYRCGCDDCLATPIGELSASNHVKNCPYRIVKCYHPECIGFEQAYLMDRHMKGCIRTAGIINNACYPCSLKKRKSEFIRQLEIYWRKHKRDFNSEISFMDYVKRYCPFCYTPWW